MRMSGLFHLKHLFPRNGYKRQNGILVPDGELELINEFSFKNGTVDEGITKLLDVVFHGVTPISPWYIGIISNAGSPVLDHEDTLASHTGWTELAIYAGNRKEWTEDAASGLSITGASASVFTFNDTGSAYGAFLCSVASGTSGTLYCTGAFPSVEAVTNGSVLNLTYTATGAAA